jgi:hypothetical protein
LTVTADPKSKLYGDPIPALTATITGFVNGDPIGVVTGAASLSTSATPASVPGSYAIMVSAGTLSATNYDFPNLIEGTLKVNKAHLTVTADAKSKFYGSALPALTYTLSGFVLGETATTAIVSGAAHLSTTATPGDGVGTYQIAVTAGSLQAPNYDFTSLVPATLKVLRAPLTIRADDQSKVYGDPIPTLTFTYSGFVNGETVANLSLPAGVSTPATASSHAGTYAITPGGAVGANYAITYVSGTLTILPAPLVITADNKIGTAGQPLPAFSATYQGFLLGDTAASLASPAVFSTTASPASGAGAYAITVTGASSPDYTITYQPGTLTLNPSPVPPPVVVVSAQFQTSRQRRHKPVTVLVIGFSDALDAGHAQNVGDYHLAAAGRGKKGAVSFTKGIGLASASYDAATHTVVLTLRGSLNLGQSLQLRISAAGVLDAWGRPLDGKHSGQPGGDFVATFGKGGVRISIARTHPDRIGF